MGRGSKGGVKCCEPRSSSSSSSKSSSSESQESITSTSSDSLDYANCQNCGPGDTPPPYAWLLHFPGMITRSPNVSCNDCGGAFDVLVPFQSSSIPGLHDDCFTVTGTGSGTASCNYALSLSACNYIYICDKETTYPFPTINTHMYLYFRGATFDIIINTTTKAVISAYASFKFISYDSQGDPCANPPPGTSGNYCIPCGTYYYNNTENKTCHDTFTMSYRLFGQPWLNSQNPCNNGTDPGDPHSLCEFDESSFATATPVF